MNDTTDGGQVRNRETYLSPGDEAALVVFVYLIAAVVFFLGSIIVSPL